MVEERAEESVEEGKGEEVEEGTQEVEEEGEAEEIEAEEEIPALPPSLEGWTPKTSLGRKVVRGEIKSIDEILENGHKILEPEIVDVLLPDLKSEVILIGGRTGKGGGIQRIPIKITAKMTKSGRRFRMSAFVVVGNEDGVVGIGSGKARDARSAILKAVRKAKMNLIKVKRGCGSWECGCGTEHSIPYKTEGKCGSVRVVLYPAPKGVGLVANDEAKKLFRLAGIKDVWMKAFGDTSTRRNLITAVYNALKNLYVYDR